MPKIFLAAAYTSKTTLMHKATPHNLLDSFYYLKPMTSKVDEYMQWAKGGDDFLLDSGAFTFMNKAKDNKNINLDEYVQKYINFINYHNIDKFFEMDLDCLMDYEEVKKLRRKIEEGTNKQCIPVWHKSRGKEEFINMCKEYEYVSIGGIASREIKKKEWEEILVPLCDIAHDNNCKIHGLGFMSLEWLNENKCPFDTVDGTAWIGSKTGHTFVIDNDEKMRKVKDDRHWRTVTRSCFDTWNDFSRIKEKSK
jgi:hypothetical protein